MGGFPDLTARTGRTLGTENSRSPAHRLSGASIWVAGELYLCETPPVTMEGYAVACLSDLAIWIFQFTRDVCGELLSRGLSGLYHDGTVLVTLFKKRRKTEVNGS
jgi:hypothetical protein